MCIKKALVAFFLSVSLSGFSSAAVVAQGTESYTVLPGLLLSDYALKPMTSVCPHLFALVDRDNQIHALVDNRDGRLYQATEERAFPVAFMNAEAERKTAVVVRSKDAKIQRCLAMQRFFGFVKPCE